MFTSLGKIIVQVNGITCLWVDKISFTANAHVIIEKYLRYLLNKFTQNNSLALIPFMWREFSLINLTNWNHPPYLLHNFILTYLMRVIRMLALLRHILVLLFNFFLQKGWYLHSWQPRGITRMVAQSSIVVHLLFIYYHVLLYKFLFLLKDKLDNLDTERVLLIV